MNLLAKGIRIKRFIKPGLIALIPVFLGCDSANDAGTKFDLNTNIDVTLAELVLPSTNLRIDSLRTDGESAVLVGSYDDPITGNITAEGYFRYSYLSGALPVKPATAAQPNPSDTLKYDSAYLELQRTDFLPLEGNATLAFDVVELVDTLKSGLTYLASKREVIDRVIGTFEESINHDDTIYKVKLSDVYGLEMFSTMSELTKDSTQALVGHQFKDLGIVPTGASKGLASIAIASENTQIKVFMSEIDPNPQHPDTVVTARFNIAGVNYSHVDRDPSGSGFNGIIEKVDFDLQDGRTVLDPIAGLTTTFNLDGLTDFFADNPNILINSATLEFTNEDLVDRNLISNFLLYFRKKDGGIFGPAIVQQQFQHIVMSDQAYLTGSINPSSAIPDEENSKYVARPTLFFQTIYNNFIDTEKLLFISQNRQDTVNISDLVLINPTEVTFTRTVFKNSGVKLKLFYTQVN